MNKNTLFTSISSIKKKGLVILKNIYSKQETAIFKKKLENVYKIRKKNKGTIGSKKNQVLYNYFYEDISLLKLIYHKKIDLILSNLLDNNYVLQSSNAQNRILINKKKSIKKKFEIGSSWHTDSRYLGSRRMEKGFSYLVIIALDAFTNNNGPTLYLPNSLKKKIKPNRKISNKLEKKAKKLIMGEGSICIMDSGIWHKAGESTMNSRWSIFNIYTGWFVKPYFDYSSITKKKIKNIHKKLLHYYSTPPKCNDKTKNTLKEFKIEKKI